MKNIILATLAIAGATAIAQRSEAAVQVLNFSGAVCGAAGAQACANGGALGANYGDTAQLNVSYRSIDSTNGQTIEDVGRIWSTGFGNLSGILYAGGGNTSMLEIVLKPAAGYEVSLLDFDFASYQRRVAAVPISITNGNGKVSIASGTYSTGGSTHGSLAVNSDYYANDIVLRFGPNAFDAGLDNLRFDVREAAVSAAPEPAAWALMLLGFGGMGVTMRRRRASAAA